MPDRAFPISFMFRKARAGGDNHSRGPEPIKPVPLTFVPQVLMLVNKPSEGFPSPNARRDTKSNITEFAHPRLFSLTVVKGSLRRNGLALSITRVRGDVRQILWFIRVLSIDRSLRDGARRRSGGQPTSGLAVGTLNTVTGSRAFQSSKVHTSSLFAVEPSTFRSRGVANKNRASRFCWCFGRPAA